MRTRLPTGDVQHGREVREDRQRRQSLIDPAGYRTELDAVEGLFNKVLAEQEANARQ